MKGTICKLKLREGYGFLRVDDQQRDLFFHCKSMDRDLPFDDTLMERRVEFDIVATEKGEAAMNVRAVI